MHPWSKVRPLLYVISYVGSNRQERALCGMACLAPHASRAMYRASRAVPGEGSVFAVLSMHSPGDTLPLRCPSKASSRLPVRLMVEAEVEAEAGVEVEAEVDMEGDEKGKSGVTSPRSFQVDPSYHVSHFTNRAPPN